MHACALLTSVVGSCRTAPPAIGDASWTSRKIIHGLPRRSLAIAGRGDHRQVRANAKPADPRRHPRHENVEGDFFVDSTCIDCDTCRWMCPEVFGRVGSMSAVVAQPTGREGRDEALHALVACPTHSIHVSNPAAGELAHAQGAFPLAVPGLHDVFHLGFHDKASYGATSYLVRRRSGGNVMMDVPRFSHGLAKRIEAMGGLSHIVLSHRDDVGAHAQWAEHFGAKRVIHACEANERQGTDACEIQLHGEGPWPLDDGIDDFEILFTPGHTAGDISTLYKPDYALFTGDSLAYSVRLQRLTIFRNYNKHSIPMQLKSIEDLAEGNDFIHLLPAHGRRWHFANFDDMRNMVTDMLKEEGATMA